jgi:hypothetical protein
VGHEFTGKSPTNELEPLMSRISIDVTKEEHQRLKAMAALQGLSIKEFVLSRTIGEQALDADLAELEALLDQRINRARTEGTGSRSVAEIFEKARNAAEPRP